MFNVPDLPGQWCLGEFKTHNLKSYTSLELHGVRNSKPQHYAQMQACMKMRGIHFTLYIAVNKNDDNLHAEIVKFDEQYADNLMGKAERVIFSKQMPKRLHEISTMEACKYCTFHDYCHNGEIAELHSCRTCKFSEPLLDEEHFAKWYCHRYQYVLSVEEQRKGCKDYETL